MALCFSAASKRMANINLDVSESLVVGDETTYKEVRNISINRPWTMDVPPPRVVKQFKVPGVIAWMMAAPYLVSWVSDTKGGVDLQ